MLLHTPLYLRFRHRQHALESFRKVGEFSVFWWLHGAMILLPPERLFDGFDDCEVNDGNF
jgi:hypothetical protein